MQTRQSTNNYQSRRFLKNDLTLSGYFSSKLHVFSPSTRCSNHEHKTQGCFPPHPYSWSILWCSCFSLRFSSNSLQLSDSRSILHFRVWPIISRFSSRGSGAGWRSTEPKFTYRKEGKTSRKRRGDKRK